MSEETVKLYQLNTAFERDVIKLCCTRPSFWGRLGNQLNPKALDNNLNKIILLACIDLYKDTQRAPGYAPNVVKQRVKQFYTAERINEDQLDACDDILDEADINGKQVDEDAIVKTLTPAIQDSLTRKVLNSFSLDYAKKGVDPAKVAAEMNAIDRVGKVDTGTGMHKTKGIAKIIAAKRNLVVLPTGIAELDSILGGGVPRQELNVVCASQGVGKSLFLSGITQQAMVDKLHIAYASMADLSEEQVWARILAGLVEIPTNDINDDALADEADRRFTNLIDGGFLPSECAVKRFTDGVATVEDIDEWMSQEEARLDDKIDLLIVDYADEVHPGKTHARAPKHEQRAQVARDLRGLSIRRDIFLWTATQSTRAGKTDRKTRIIETDDSGESLGLPKQAALFLSINKRDDNIVVIHVGKNRHGTGNTTLLDLPNDAEYGRMVDPARVDWPYKRTVPKQGDSDD